MTDPEKPRGCSELAREHPSTERKRAWKVRIAGRLCVLLVIPLTYLYVRDVPRAFHYMLSGELPPKLNVLWLEHSLRRYYFSGKFAKKVFKAALPASALGFSGLLLLLGCAAPLARERVMVSRFEALVWTAAGALLLGINAMATWIIWKAFVFL